MNSLSEKKRNPYIKHHIKKNLDIIVLTFLAKEPLCGRDLIRSIHTNFNVMVSSGTLYPLLRNLEQKGLIVSESGMKTVIYKPADQASVQKVIKSHIDAKAEITNFLKGSSQG